VRPEDQQKTRACPAINSICERGRRPTS
jgi:hypothetical protein